MAKNGKVVDLEQQAKDRILVLGAAGMLGHTVFRFFFKDPRFETFGTVRSTNKLHHFSARQNAKLIDNIDVQSDSSLISVFAEIRPSLVINCVGIIKQLDAAKNHLASLAINASLPHRLAQYCCIAKARLVHLSTDCVFSGKQGMYLETDFPDADDLYGRTKLLGEVDYPHAITLRTSIIGHELESARSLVDWFLSQEDSVVGYKKAVFSGLPAIEIARVIRDCVLPNPQMHGLYHLSVTPIDKHDLLSRVARIYRKPIEIIPDETINIDRSLNSERFRAATGYQPPSWDELIARMHKTYQTYETSNV